MNDFYKFLIGKSYLIFFVLIFYSVFIVKSSKQLIKEKIQEMGGEIISLHKGERYINEVNKIENYSKRRPVLITVYKIEYKLDDKNRIMYYVYYRNIITFSGKKNWFTDWIEKPLEE